MKFFILVSLSALVSGCSSLPDNSQNVKSLHVSKTLDGYWQSVIDQQRLQDQAAIHKTATLF